MRKSYCVLVLVGLSAAACSSKNFPPSPVPGLLNDRQAVTLANMKLNEENPAPRMLTRLEREPWGYLVGYRTMFNATAKPPLESHLVAVNNDGEVTEWRFTD